MPAEIKTKACTKCKEEKELTEFAKDKNHKDGRSSRCKKCLYAIHKVYQETHRDSCRTANRKSYHKNREYYLAKNKERYWAKRERLIEYGRSRYRLNKASISQKAKRKNHESYESLSDSYVRSLLVKRNGLSCADIPQELVDAKRAHLKLGRAIKQAS